MKTTRNLGDRHSDGGWDGEYEELAPIPKFEAKMFYHALHRKVLAVARTRIEGTWKAYIVPVPGQNHDREMVEHWREEGFQLPEGIARAIFGCMEDVPYAR